MLVLSILSTYANICHLVILLFCLLLLPTSHHVPLLAHGEKLADHFVFIFCPVKSVLLVSLQLAFCAKEQEQLSKRFKEIQKQLSEEQSLELNVKLETSDKRTPLICVGDNSDSDDDVVFILPEDYSPLKRRKLDDAKKAETFEDSGDQPKKDVSITYFKPATSLPHAREHCAVHKFVQSNVTTATVSCNESYCEQCYCYVCDVPVKEVSCSQLLYSGPYCTWKRPNVNTNPLIPIFMFLHIVANLCCWSCHLVFVT